MFLARCYPAEIPVPSQTLQPHRKNLYLGSRILLSNSSGSSSALSLSVASPPTPSPSRAVANATSITHQLAKMADASVPSMFRQKEKPKEDMGLANQASYNTGNTVSGSNGGGGNPAVSSASKGDPWRSSENPAASLEE